MLMNITVDTALIIQSAGYVGMVFGLGMGYQKIIDRIKVIENQRKEDMKYTEAAHDDLKYEIRELRKTINERA